MMVRGVPLILAALFCAVSSLTTFKAPSLPAWKLAILVGEFGHWLWPLPLVLAVVGVAASPAGSWWRNGTWVLSAIALVFLAKPSVQAWLVGQDLRERLRGEFGAVNLPRAPFSVARLFVSSVDDTPVRSETLTFSRPKGTTPLSLDFYYATTTDSAPAACILVIHGGGWDGGDRHQFESFNRHLARRGYAVAAMDYRLAPQFKWPAQREDAEAALRFLEQNSTKLGIDPRRVVVFGRSAGGQIAESLAYDRTPLAVRGVISFYSPADLYFAWHYTKEDDLLNSFLLMRQYLGGTPEEVPAAFTSASPYLHVPSPAVPTLLAHGKLDALVWHRQSERLAARLQETHTPSVFLDLPWATHAFDYNPHGPSGQLSTFAIEWFLQAVVGPKRS